MSDPTPRAPQACRDLFERLSDYIDGELPAGLCSQIEQHIGNCPPCQEFLASLRETVELMQRVESPPLPDEIRGSLRAAYERYRRGSDQD